MLWNQKNDQRPLRDLPILDAKATRKSGSVSGDGRPASAANDRIVGRRRTGDPNQQTASGFGSEYQALQAEDHNDQRGRVYLPILAVWALSVCADNANVFEV
jgi:hypothetical protein